MKENIDYLAILNLFTMPDGERSNFDTTEPFLDGDFVAATNGHVGCYVSAKLLPEIIDNPDMRTPKGIVLKATATQIVDTYEVKTSDLFSEKLSSIKPKLEICHFCLAGKVCECACGFEHECKHCDERGCITTTPAIPKCKVHGITLNYEYVDIVRRAALMAGEDALTWESHGSTGISIIRFGECTVLLMPIVNSLPSDRAEVLIPSKKGKVKQ